ncbi:MAG: hypothetical protein ACTS27_08730, partial [Phycisphaerales bacterium]
LDALERAADAGAGSDVLALVDEHFGAQLTPAQQTRLEQARARIERSRPLADDQRSAAPDAEDPGA